MFLNKRLCTPVDDGLSKCNSRIFVHPADGACQEVQGLLQCIFAAVVHPHRILPLSEITKIFVKGMKDMAAHLDFLAQRTERSSEVPSLSAMSSA